MDRYILKLGRPFRSTPIQVHFFGGNMAAYGKAAQSKVKKVMEEKKRGTLRSGSGKKVTSRKQAIAIGLSEARKAGAKVPNQK